MGIEFGSGDHTQEAQQIKRAKSFLDDLGALRRTGIMPPDELAHLAASEFHERVMKPHRDISLSSKKL